MAKCEDCEGDCCNYVTVQIDKPVQEIDFEELKWFLCHENIMVYIDNDGDWCVEFKTPCKNLDMSTKLCKIYQKRPKVCSDHDPDECEKNDDYDPYYERAFLTMEDIDEYREEVRTRRKAQKLQQRSLGKAEKAE